MLLLTLNICLIDGMESGCDEPDLNPDFLDCQERGNFLKQTFHSKCKELENLVTKEKCGRSLSQVHIEL